MKLLQDNYINDLMISLKARAEVIRESAGSTTTDDIEIQLRWWFSKQYNIPMRSAILDEYTLPEMLLEFYLHNYEPPAPISTEDLIKDNRNDLADMIASEFSDDDNKFMDDVFGKDNS